LSGVEDPLAWQCLDDRARWLQGYTHQSIPS
jgi:hypothetical protein